jgi:hypothetical protein
MNKRLLIIKRDDGEMIMIDTETYFLGKEHIFILQDGSIHNLSPDVYSVYESYPVSEPNRIPLMGACNFGPNVPKNLTGN